MGNIDNLIPGGHKLTLEEQSAGGKASAEARRRKKDIRLALEMLLEKDFTDKSGNSLSGTEVIATAMFKKAKEGSVNAFTAIRDTVGQAPVQKIEAVSITNETREEVQDLINAITEGSPEGITDQS